MTVSATDIPFLHSIEVARLYIQVVLPIYQGIATSHSSLPRRRGRVPLEGKWAYTFPIIIFGV
jgi:hypothetical protein